MSGAANYFVNVVAHGLSRVLGMGAGFFCFVLFARMLGTEALGRLAFVMAFVTIAGNIADFGTNSALAKDLAEHRDRDPAHWFGNFLLIRVLLAGLTIALCAAVGLLIGGELLPALLLGSLATPFMAARFFDSLFQIFGRPHYSVITALVLGVTQIGLCAGALLAGAGLLGYVAAFTACQVLYFVLALSLSGRLVKPRLAWHGEHTRALFRIATPMGVSALLMTVSSRADVFMLSYWRSSEEVGLYNAAYRLLDLGIALAVTVSLPLVPILTRSLRQDREATRSLCVEIMGFVLAALLPVAIVASSLAGDLLTLLYGPRFAAAAPVLATFAWQFMLTVYWMVASTINLAAGNMGYNYGLSLAAALVTIGTNALLIPRMGITGAALGVSAGTVLTTLVVLWNVRRSVGSIQRVSIWLRLVIAAASLHLLLGWVLDAWPQAHVLVVCSGAALVYLVLAFALGLVPIDRLRQLAHLRRSMVTARP